MPNISIEEITQYVEEHIGEFHADRLEKLKKTKLREILKRKNPYLYKVTAKESAPDFINAILSASISSSEETIFGNWLEGLARFVNARVYGGEKAGIKGLDLVFVKEGVRYIVSIKSGPHWGNSSSISKLMNNFADASKSYNTVARGERRYVNEYVVGCCYGKDENSTKRKDNVFYHKYCGQKFWFFISGMPELYTKIIEPLGKDAFKRDEKYQIEYNKILNKLVQEFLNGFCNDGLINWQKLVEYNSGAQSLEDVIGFD